MERIRVYNYDSMGEDQYVGWFDREKAEVIEKYEKGSPYVTGKVLYLTAKGNLIINTWNNSGLDTWKIAYDEKEVAEIVSAGNEETDVPEIDEVLLNYEL